MLRGTQYAVSLERLALCALPGQPCGDLRHCSQEAELLPVSITGNSYRREHPISISSVFYLRFGLCQTEPLFLQFTSVLYHSSPPEVCLFF